MTTRVRSVVLAGSALTVAGVLASGCSSLSSPPASGSAGTGSTGSGTSTSAPAAAGSTSAGPAATPSTSGATSGATTAASPSPAGAAGAGGGAPACTTAELKTFTGDGGGGAAGSFYSLIDFTNTSSAPCTLYGYPGVSLTNAQAAQIGAAATRGVAPEAAPSLVTLAPGATAHATLKMTDYTVYPTSQCKPATATYLLIYPPNQKQSVKLVYKTGTCSNSSIKMLAVSVVSSGQS